MAQASDPTLALDRALHLSGLLGCPWARVGLGDTAPQEGTPIWDLKAESLFLVEDGSRLREKARELAWEGLWNVLEVGEAFVAGKQRGSRVEQP